MAAAKATGRKSGPLDLQQRDGRARVAPDNLHRNALAAGQRHVNFAFLCKALV